jgi:choline monooxygenase
LSGRRSSSQQIAKAGDFVAGEFAGLSYIVGRDQEGLVRAFHNTCRHHAARILPVGEVCGAKQFVCPYHGWTYRLDGKLAAAPRMNGARNFSLDCHSLVSIRCETWGPWVWICFDEGAAPLFGTVGELEKRLPGESLLGMHFHSRRTYEIRCNWKVYVDNYLDGGYHVPVLHRGLSSQLDMSSYRTEIFDRMSIQSCEGRSGASERIGNAAVYAWLYPGFMINRYGPVLDTNWVIPISHDRTLTVFDFYFEDISSKAAKQFITASLESSEKVQQEDLWISECVQKGLGGPAYDRGRYAPEVEQAEHHFHRMLARDLAVGASVLPCASPRHSVLPKV